MKIGSVSAFIIPESEEITTYTFAFLLYNPRRDAENREKENENPEKWTLVF